MMAMPIKETPILTGEDARRFDERMKEAEAGKRKVSREEYLRAQKAYESIEIKIPEK